MITADPETKKDVEFREVFRAEVNGVTRAAYLVVGDWGLAQEVAQDAFVELYIRWRQVSTYDSIGGWLRRIAIRRALRKLRHAPFPVATPTPDLAEAVASKLTLHNGLRLLPPKQRAALVLFYLEDLPVEQVAQALGCSPATVKVHLHRGRHTLASAMEGDRS